MAWAALLVAGCAGAGPVHPDLEPLRAEIRSMHRENEVLAARLDALSHQVDLLTMRATQPEARAQPAPPSPGGAPADGARPSGEAAGPVVPPDLAVVKVAPPPEPRAAGRAGMRAVSRPAREAPPVPTSVPIRDPDLSRLDELGRVGRRPLAAEAEQELREARALTGLVRAHALEDFTTRYPQHSAADNALVEAAAEYAEAGREEAACALARRVVVEYPAGDALSDALERLAACEERRGAVESAQRLLARLRADHPGTPAAQRAEVRLSQDPGRSGDATPREPARSVP